MKNGAAPIVLPADMEAPGEAPAEEIARLRRCLNDLASVMALPAFWAGGEPQQIVDTLLDALRKMLRLAFVFVRLNDSEGGPPVEMMRADASLDRAVTARSLGETLDQSLGAETSQWGPGARVSIGDADVHVASVRLGLGLQGELGVLVAGCERPGFPAQPERLLLEIAANQATLGLQEARLQSERQRIARELDERVAQRTSELAIANEALQTEVTERRRAEEALRERERESRLILDSTPGLIALLTETGDVEVVNRQLTDYFGQTLEELKQWGTNDTVHPEDLPQVIDVFTRAIASGSPYEIVQRFKRWDGVYRWFQNSGCPVRGADGHILRWCVLLTDVDDRKRAEDALRDSERDSRLIVDSIPGLIAVFTPGGEAELVNRQVLEYFGKTFEELQQWRTGDSTHPEDLPRVIEHFARSIAAGIPFDWQSRARRFDGVYRWVQTRGAPLRDASGHIVRWYSLIIDIDERKRAEEALAASERNLKLIIDTIPALAWSIGPDGAADFFNQHYLDFLGFSAEQASGWGWTAAIHPEDVTALAATWQRRMSAEVPGEAEARMRRHDGEYRWFLFRANPLRDESGAIVKWYGVSTDIEDRKRAEAEIRRAYDSFADAQRLSHTGSFITDLVGDDHNWSEEAYRIFEFDPRTKISVQRVRDIIHPDDLPAFEAVIARGMSGVDVNFAFRIVAVRGAVKHVRGVAHVVERSAGRPMFVGALQDVTESKVAEEALDRARSELAHVARVTTLGALTASIAHEVNQPLSGIITNASTCLRMLGGEPPNVEGARETARRAIRDGHRASDVITRLRVLFSKKEFTLEQVDLNDATREVLALVSSDLRRDRVILQSALVDDLPPILGDRVQLQQVILNLLRNGSEAMAGVDDRPRQLLVRTEREDGDRARLTVRDAGVGIDPQSMDKLFEAFYTTKSGGMGIGLSVSRSIIERHHGRLWVEQEDGPGAAFTFSIPSRSGYNENSVPVRSTS